MTANTNAVNPNYVEVYIWRGKDRDGFTTTSSEGIRHGLEDQKEASRGAERCGHVSMGIFRQNQPEVYVSLWPGRVKPAVPVPNLTTDQDANHEGTLPDVIVRLHHLKMDEMVTAFNQVKPRIDNDEISWQMDVSDHQDVTDVKNTTASCASFVWTFLKIGGLEDKASPYYANTSLKGPQSADFYNVVKCNLGQRFWGWFDGFWWTREHFTPYALSLRVASAAEAFQEDQDRTVEIMLSGRVAKEREGFRTSTITATSVGVAAAAVIGLILNKN